MSHDDRKPKDPENTRSRILDAALDVFSNKGYHDTKVDDIVEISSTSKGSIYFHFPNKQTIFLALVDKFAELLEKRIVEAIEQEQIGIARVRAALRACLDTFGKYRLLAKIMLVQAVGLGSIFEDKRLEVSERFVHLIKDYVDQAITVGDVPPVDTEIVARAWMGAIYEIVIRWVYTGEPTPERIMSTLLPMLLRSIGYDDEGLL
ncbi:MAG: TetR/AcrR family transcriptional regulator [Anaerolineae bacterium]|jgi:AcrR family transcriptional regulator|nr:TetR/AcrR family transcriptional regulator [Anaerolineae bacterium]